MCQNSTDSQKPLSGAWAKVQGHATAQLQLSNQSPTMRQPVLSDMKPPWAKSEATTSHTGARGTARMAPASVILSAPGASDSETTFPRQDIASKRSGLTRQDDL